MQRAGKDVRALNLNVGSSYAGGRGGFAREAVDNAPQVDGRQQEAFAGAYDHACARA